MKKTIVNILAYLYPDIFICKHRFKYIYEKTFIIIHEQIFIASVLIDPKHSIIFIHYYLLSFHIFRCQMVKIYEHYQKNAGIK